jgi:hypothetical protein
MTLNERLIDDPLAIADQLEAETEHIYPFHVTVSHLFDEVNRGERKLTTVVTASKVEELVERKVDAEREKLELIGDALRYNGYFIWEQVYMRPAVRLAGRTEKQWRLLTPELDDIVEFDVSAREERLREFEVGDFVECKYGSGEVDPEKVQQCRQRALDVDGEAIVESLVEALEGAEGPARPKESDGPSDA